jgi:hypothetical protein
MGDLDMAEIAKGVLFISACASLYGLGVFLFRDQIKGRRRFGPQCPLSPSFLE